MTSNSITTRTLFVWVIVYFQYNFVYFYSSLVKIFIFNAHISLYIKHTKDKRAANVVTFVFLKIMVVSKSTGDCGNKFGFSRNWIDCHAVLLYDLKIFGCPKKLFVVIKLRYDCTLQFSYLLNRLNNLLAIVTIFK